MSQRKLRFLLVGAWNTLFGFFTFLFLFHTITYKNPQLTLFISFVIATFQSHLSQRILVWKSNASYLNEFSKYATGSLGLYFLNVFTLEILIRHFAMQAIFAQLISLCISILVSYFLQLKVVFTS